MSPYGKDGGISIQQQAWFSLGKFEKNKTTQYKIKRKGNGAYIFVIEGSVNVNGILLNNRDGLGIWDIEQLELKFINAGEILIMDVPMQIG